MGTCSNCGGSGSKKNQNTCSDCGGTGSDRGRGKWSKGETHSSSYKTTEKWVNSETGETNSVEHDTH